MAKNKRPDYKITEGSVISVIKQNTTKNGKIRGKNKKQTRVLRGACVHHTLNKNGKVKPTIYNDGKQTCTCRMCQASFKGRPYDKEEVINKIKGAKEVVNQLKYLSVAVNAGNDAVRYASELGSMMECLPKNYRKVASIAEKAESVRNKKKKKKNGSDFSTIGSWR